ncbi:iron-sulfur cluster-binding domain-containing protein [Aquirufa sp. HETE-83D]|uniref:Iron-sulfur cluster-binding domain-containing protein n=1 Tax=Aquirufa esocilacus TaxID=3096513 RepID=A0ABW6DLI4_9BACT
MEQYTLAIQDIRNETDDTITICFKQPGLRKMKYQAGQYMTLIFKINGRRYSRPYSFSSAPSVDSTLDVTVKRVPKGIVSNYILNEIKVGDVVEVVGPTGDFIYLPVNVNPRIYLWGVGSGITPLFSLAKEILSSQPSAKIHLVYGNKYKVSTIFLEKILELQKKYKSEFNVTLFFSQELSLDEKDGFYGRISSSFVSDLVSNNSEGEESQHYICGPKGLKEAVKNSLLELSISESAIYSEEFQILIDPKELDGVKDSMINFYFNGDQVKIFGPKGKSVLNSALDHNLEIPYSCQTGICNSCKATVVKGNLKMIGLSQERKDLNTDEFLLCCSYPITNELVIKVN